MHVFSTLISGLGLFAHLIAAGYTLQDDYGTTDSFFDKFDFYTVCWIMMKTRSVTPKTDSTSDRARTPPTAT
jgi:hypothetical protein